jgi:hypothetical protein
MACLIDGEEEEEEEEEKGEHLGRDLVALSI